MVVQTRVSDNLLIAPTAIDSTAKEDESAFKTNYINHINAVLEPVSAIDGATFYYTKTNNVNASGDAISDNYIAYVENDAFDENYGFTTDSAQEAYGYKDYAFQLKAVNSSNAERTVNVTGLNFIYNGTQDADTSAEPDMTEKAYRVAIFVDNMGEDGTTAASATQSSTNLLSILRESSATYFTPTKAVNGATTLADVNTKIDDQAQIGTLAAGKTNYYKVVVRIWLEGEDTTCNNTTFAKLTSDWALNMDIELQETATPISNITKSQATSATPVIVDLTAGGITVSGTPIVIDGANYYTITGATLTGATNLSGKTICTDTATITSASHIYMLTDNRYLTEVTNQCKLPTATP